jgi:transglutaminase-like putative cysteine protease
MIPVKSSAVVSLRVLAGLLSLLSSPLRAADFPPISDEERALTAVPGEPNALAVVLFKKGEFLMMGYGQAAGGLASHLRIEARVKILTEAGKSNGEILIAHSDFTKLEGFEGRTVLPDGRILPVPADARFVRKASLSRKTFATAVAFPAVEVGAILDYRYELVFESPFLFDPWYFSEELPVRHSEIVFKTAPGWQMRPWSRAPFGAKIQQEQQSTPQGEVLRAWAEDLPAVPDDPYGPPYADLATQMMLLPVLRGLGPYGPQPLFDKWSSLSWLLGKTYEEVRRKDLGVAQQARRIAASGSPRQKTEALYRFVRDEIETRPEPGVFIDSAAALRTILTEHRGSPAEKALLLQTMLKAVGIDSALVWAGDRNRGDVDFQVVNPNWFDTVLVLVELNGERSFLDPSDRALAFGQLRPGHEGTTALMPRSAAQWQVRLPEAPLEQNARHAEIDLALDEQGRLSGRGSLRLTGARAWERMSSERNEAQPVQTWEAWLAERFRDFQISGVESVEAPDERKIVVTWSMAQRQEEVLGDEASVVPSAPLEPVIQPLLQPSSRRKTMVMFDYAERNEVELHLRWPESWKAESLPEPTALENQVGALAVSVELKPSERSLVYRRRFDIARRLLRSPQEYDQAQLLFGEAAKSDAQKLLLVRR